LAIIPSLTDNSPCVIYECLENGVAFFASAAGGGKELIHKDDREYITFEPNKNALAALIIRGFNTKLIPLARPSYSIDGIVCKWEELFAELQDQPSSSQYSPMDCDKKTPLVSLILVHHNRHRLLEISLQSCLEQDYPNLEIILVDDGSTEPESLAYLDDLERTNRQDPRLRILRCENRYLGAARNAGVKVASGEYVVFLDDDNIALPNMVSRYVAAVLHSGADAVSGAMRYFYEQDGRPNIKASNNPIYVFWGGRQRYSAMLTNHLGDATGIYRKEIVIKAGGFHENFGVTHEDWKMYADIERLGGRIVTIPDMMYWYRVTSGSMIKSTKQYLNAQMHLLPYAQRLPRNFAHLPFVLFAILNNQDIYSSGYCHPVYWQYTIQFARIIRRFPRFEKMVVRILETSYPMLKRCFHSLRQWYHRTKT
jgi:glycosyltransferase involved in cell wall biosynthesis